MRNFMLSNGMVDLGFSGPKFTWSNKRSGATLILECLDRGIANGDWRILFPRATISHGTRIASDHSHLLLDTFGDQNLGPRPFRFETFRVKVPSCRAVVARTWSYYFSGFPTLQ